ncbi:MAG: hypothetical protein E7471_05175 [Ruminococcaceae bacterium]|nr:hypothetical protein [Oscillospiraceae bacterium]
MKRNKNFTRRICLLLALLITLTPIFTLSALGAAAGASGPRLAVPMVGIDVSSWDGEIDWAKVKEAGVEFAIVRMFNHIDNTPDYEIDEQFERNVREAQKYGIHLGAYFFSYAQDLDAITGEANMVVEELKKYPGVFSFPIVFDAEDGDKTDDPDVDGGDIYDISTFAGDAAKTFCDIVSANGYYPMVYSYTQYFKSTIGLSKVQDYDLWLAAYPKDGSDNQIYAGTGPADAVDIDHNEREKFGDTSRDCNVTMWQYTDEGEIDGIYAGDGGSANVALNVSYVDYPSLIARGGYNGYEKMDASVDVETTQITSFAAGESIPAGNYNDQNPNIVVTGLREGTNHYKGLENYGSNKEKIIINGRTWDKWESRPGTQILKNIWISEASDEIAYLGIEIGDTSRLKVKGTSGIGETIDTIVIKRGFEIVSTTSNLWDSGEIATDSADVESVVGVFKENVILVANDTGGFDVTFGGSESLGLEGYSFQVANSQLVKITADANVQSGPSTSSEIIGLGIKGATFEYLDEIQNDEWLKIDYNGQVGWVSNVNASIVNVPQHIQLTADANIRIGPDGGAVYASIGVGLKGHKFEYLNEIQNTKWQKVGYNGQIGWISNANTKFVATNTVFVNAENSDWVEPEPADITISTVNGAQIRTHGVQGLRFTSTIQKSGDFVDVQEFGTVLIPSADISDISELEIGEIFKGHAVAKVPAKNYYAETDDAITFTAVITNIADKNLSREYTARAYAILKDGRVVYADTGASRSVYAVAKKGLENPAESAANIAIFQSIVDMVEGANDNDASWPWN